MEAIILGNPFLYDFGTLTPIVIPAYEAEEAVVELTSGYNPYIIGAGSSGDSYWIRSATDLLRPILTTDRVVIGGASFISTESLRVVGTINITNLIFGSESTYITSIKDEDDLVSNSEHAIPTQQSVKAYVDSLDIGLQPGDNISLLTNNVPYLITETDPVFIASVAYGLTSTQVTHWDTAYGWGNHAIVGYLTVETDPIFAASEAYSITSTDTTQWDTAYTNNHTHTNKALLDTLTTAGGGTSALFDDGTYKTVATVLGGADTYVQYNNGGVLGGDSTFFFNESTKLLTVQDIYVSNQIDFNATPSTTYIHESAGNLTFVDAISGSVSLATLIAGAVNYWVPTTGGIYYSTGTDKVGIGTSTLSSEILTVNGNIEATDFNSSYLRYKNSNLLLGTNAGDNETGSNLLYISNSNTATPLMYGDFINQEIIFNADVYINTVKRLAFGDSTVSIRRDSNDNLEFRDLNANSGDPVLLSDLVIGDLSLYSLKSDFISYASVNSISAANLVTWGKASILTTAGAGTLFLTDDGTYQSGGGGGVTPTDYTFKFDLGSVYYRPYTDKTEAGGVSSSGKFYGGTTNPTATNRLNYDGNLHVNALTTTDKLTVGGLIDPTGLQLTSVATNPGDTNTLWSNSGDSNSLYYGTIPISNGVTPISVTAYTVGTSVELTTLNSGTQFVQLTAFINNPLSHTLSYEWFFEGSTFDYELTTNASLEGVYVLIVTDDDTGLTYSSEVNVLTYSGTEAEPALGNPASNGYILSSTTAGVRSWIASTSNPVDDILHWSTNKYIPYSAPTYALSTFYTGTTNPGFLDRLNLDAYLYVSQFRSNSIIECRAGQSSAIIEVPGIIKDFYTDVSTSGTSETDMYTYAIPAYVLNNNGDKLTAKFIFDNESTTATITSINVYFAGTPLVLLNTGSVTNGEVETIIVDIIRVSSSTARMTVQLLGISWTSNKYIELTSKNWATANILKFTIQLSSGTLIAKQGYIEYKPAAIN